MPKVHPHPKESSTVRHIETPKKPRGHQPSYNPSKASPDTQRCMDRFCGCCSKPVSKFLDHENKDKWKRTVNENSIHKIAPEPKKQEEKKSTPVDPNHNIPPTQKVVISFQPSGPSFSLSRRTQKCLFMQKNFPLKKPSESIHPERITIASVTKRNTKYQETKENTPPKELPGKTGERTPGQSARLSPLRSPKLTQEGKNMIGGGADASSPSRPPRRHLGSRSNSPSPEKLQSPRMAF